MKDNGLCNVMDLIKRQRWENLFKRREFVHIDAVKEFYARMTVIHLKKKDVVKTSVRGVAIEFDHLKLASILGIPGNNGICEYIKDVWKESKYTKPLQITKKFANDETLTAARRVKSGSGEKFYDAEYEIQEPATIVQEVPAEVAQASAQQKVTEAAGVDLFGPAGHLPETLVNKLQAEFERARADRIHADLEKAQTENARLLAVLQQA
ncbi:hypothetical protein Dimus_018262 [Dionaea muscipula]